MGQPIIFVSANHRLNVFGTLTGEEINDAGIPNLLLKDQRVAMQWIQKYIANFGGDPNRVTIFGESAGSFSVATHMVLNDGDTEGLFQGAIMASGGVLKVKGGEHEQSTFDFVASECGCGSATDKIACLKEVDYELLYNVAQRIPNFFSFTSTKTPWYPRADGTYLLDSPHRLLRQGKVADIPYIIGDMKDEGTLFSIIPQLNITNDADLRTFWKQLYFQSATDEQVQAFTDMYSEDPSEGSPYDTGLLNQLGPQYKRLASSVGDYTFESGRRDLLEQTYAQGKRSIWTYQIEQSIPVLGQLGELGGLTGLPVLGSFHVSDVVLNTFGTLPPAISRNSRDIMNTYIAFVNSQDPNTHGLEDLPEWPKWAPEGKAMFRYREGGAEVIVDDYREEQMRFLNDNAEIYMF